MYIWPNGYEYRNDPAVLDLVLQQQEIIEKQQEIIEGATSLKARLFRHFDLDAHLSELRKSIEEFDLAHQIREVKEKAEALSKLCEELEEQKRS